MFFNFLPFRRRGITYEWRRFRDFVYVFTCNNDSCSIMFGPHDENRSRPGSDAAGERQGGVAGGRRWSGERAPMAPRLLLASTRFFFVVRGWLRRRIHGRRQQFLQHYIDYLHDPQEGLLAPPPASTTRRCPVMETCPNNGACRSISQGACHAAPCCLVGSAVRHRLAKSQRRAIL